MSTRALVGTQGPCGTFQVRSVHCDGYPILMVPTLTAIWRDTFNRNLPAAIDALLSHSWTSLDPDQGPTPSWWWRTDGYEAKVGRFSPNDSPTGVEVGLTDEADPGDREWTYLFTGERLTVHVGVGHRWNRKGIWRLAACWPVLALPHISSEELIRVQRYGYRMRKLADVTGPAGLDELLAENQWTTNVKGGAR